MISRAIANKILFNVINNHYALNTAFDKYLPKDIDPLNKSFIKECCFGVLRWFHQLSHIKSVLLFSPLKKKDADIDSLILLGLFQILHSNVPDHAAVSETVSVCKKIRKAWATKLVNKCLRRFIDEKDTILASLDRRDYKYSHPNWMIDEIKNAFPERWTDILEQNNLKPPLWLRVNLQKTTRQDFIKSLREKGVEASKSEFSPCAVLLNKPTPINSIPHFNDGFASIQDLAGQFAAYLLALDENLSVLDACAAPGSKTGHILELEPRLKKLTIVDRDASRFPLIKENLERLQLNQQCCEFFLEDIMECEKWWDGHLFDRILLDAPCSSTGVIRRHPDIKLLRKEKDVVSVVETQKQMLEYLWNKLKVDGKLLYSTCSILPEENEEVISDFLKRNKNAKVETVQLPLGEPQEFGVQFFPEEMGPDGFYYALLSKID